MRYLSLFSGIEAASLAWQPLGWQAVAFSEVETFCCELLRQRFPSVPNLGDVTAPDFVDRAKALGPIDLVVGGSPCQSFSVAGLRGGMADARGNLALRFVEVVDGLDPTWTLWENVPGVLSDKTNGFGCLLGALAGSGAALVPPRECGWTDAGVVVGPRRSVAWRILDAQWFGVAQRRKRVFALAGRGVGAERVSEVLLEHAGVRRDPPTRRAKGEGIAADPAYCIRGSGPGTERVVDTRGQDNVVACFGGGNTRGAVDVATACNAKPGSRDDFESETFVAFTQNQRDEVRELGDTAGALSAEPGMKQQTYVAFSSKDHGADAGDLPPTLRAAGHDGSHANAGAPPAVVCPSLTAFNMDSRSPQSEEQQRTVEAVHAATMMVRRLTPRECERLQGMPDDWTLVTVRGKPAADGPRYKAIGNSMAVPVMRWIGSRLDSTAR